MNIIINPYIFKNVPATTLLNGLLACWEFNETSGTTVYDETGNYNGTNQGATINQSGKIDKAYDFDGVDDHVNVGNTLTNGLIAITVSAWVYGHPTKGEYFMILGKNKSTWTHPYYEISFRIRLDRGYTNYEMFIGGDAAYQGLTVDNSYKANTWQHVVFTWDGNTKYFKAYIDGSFAAEELDINNISQMSSNTTDLIIGYYGGAYQSTFKNWEGLIDQVAIWNRALTQQEISDLYNNGNGRAYTNF
jgi:hypothetical protein